MSVFSGKCDLFDHISFEKMYNNGSYKVSDELECFEIFKKRTGGKIYQHYLVKVTELNQDKVKDYCKDFDFTKIETKVPDKRMKEGFKIITSYTYTYYGTEYKSLKELNKHGVYIEQEITFNTLLDIIPYYSYVIAFSASDENSEHVVIANESYPMSEFNDGLKYGTFFRFPNWENQRLQEHYIEVCKKYFLYKVEERTKQIDIVGIKPLHNKWYELILPKAVDYMHEDELKYVWKDGNVKTHWCNPKMKEGEPNVLLLHESDVENFLAEDIKTGNVVIEYVETCDFPNEARDSEVKGD